MKNYYKVFKKDDRKSLDKECLRLWALIVKLRAGNKCEVCEKKNYLNAHHVFSKSRRSVRYDLQNGLCLCSGCHSLTNESAHKDPSFIKKILGEIPGYKPLRTKAWWDNLYQRAYTPQKLDLKMELLYLKQELKKYA
jgi:hypothetical protein